MRLTYPISRSRGAGFRVTRVHNKTPRSISLLKPSRLGSLSTKSGDLTGRPSGAMQAGTYPRAFSTSEKASSEAKRTMSPQSPPDLQGKPSLELVQGWAFSERCFNCSEYISVVACCICYKYYESRTRTYSRTSCDRVSAWVKCG